MPLRNPLRYCFLFVPSSSSSFNCCSVRIARIDAIVAALLIAWLVSAVPRDAAAALTSVSPAPLMTALWTRFLACSAAFCAASAFSLSLPDAVRGVQPWHMVCRWRLGLMQESVCQRAGQPVLSLFCMLWLSSFGSFQLESVFLDSLERFKALLQG